MTVGMNPGEASIWAPPDSLPGGRKRGEDLILTSFQGSSRQCDFGILPRGPEPDVVTAAFAKRLIKLLQA
jgi:hypothetical protein